MSLSPKPARFSQAEQINIVMSGHINGAGRLFGGILVEWIDVVTADAMLQPPLLITCNSNLLPMQAIRLS